MSPRTLHLLSRIRRSQRDARTLRICRRRGVQPYSAHAILTYRATRDDYRRLMWPTEEIGS